MANADGKEYAPENTPPGQDYAAQSAKTSKTRRHETADVNTRRIVIATGILIALLAGAQFALKGFEHALKTEKSGPAGSPLAPPAFGPQIPPVPRLQADPQTEIDALKAEQTGLLTSYGWTDEPRRAVHIPIEQAKARLLQTGLPNVGAKPSPPPAPLPDERPAADAR